MANNQRSKQKQPVEQVIVESIFKGLYFLVTYPFRKNKKQGLGEKDRQEIERHWAKVLELAGNSPTVAQAISEGDKLVDYAMQKRGIPGTTMGERLKNAERYYSPADYQKLWNAHKLRNRLAHDMGVTLNEYEAREAVSAFRKALDNL